MKDLVFKQDYSLNELDKINETFGCRHTNSEICSNNRLASVCAFVRTDKICKKPPRTWAKIYKKLIEEKNIV